MFAVKECFQYNQASTRHRHMRNAFAGHQWVGQEVVMDICICFTRVVRFTAHVKCLFLRVWPCRMRIRVCVCHICQLELLAHLCVCVRVWYSFHILSKAWFPRGNDRGHLIGEGWKQHLHPIGHTHDIKVLARQKHVKEIYITALTAPHTQGHRPLPLPIIKVTVHLLCLNSTFPITNKNITGRFFFSFFVTGIITLSIRSVCIKLPIRIREWASRREMIRLAQPLCMDLNNKREISLKALSTVPIRERGKWENGRVQREITANWGYNEHV